MKWAQAMIKRYLITDPSFYTSSPKTVLDKLLQIKEIHRPDFICLRDKQTTNYASIAKMLMHPSLHDDATKLLLHTDVQLASLLGCHGVHLPSNALSQIEEAKSLGLMVVASTHTLEEALFAQSNGTDAITMSPIFATPNKGEPLGLEKLKEINDRIHIKCFALGGIINTDQVNACEDVGVYGFASIRFFLD